MYLLRLIRNDEKTGKFIVDSWKSFAEYRDLLHHLVKSESQEFQAYEAKEITNEAFHEIELHYEKEEKEERRKIYEELKHEFESKTITT